MYPKGQLRRKDGSPNDHSYRYREVTGDDIPANTYVDDAGVEWILLEDWQNKEHQPVWFDAKGAAPNSAPS